MAAASARTPPAERVKAALSGGLFRSVAAALKPGQVSVAEAVEMLHEDHVVFVDTRDPAEVVKTGAPRRCCPATFPPHSRQPHPHPRYKVAPLAYCRMSTDSATPAGALAALPCIQWYTD